MSNAARSRSADGVTVNHNGGWPHSFTIRVDPKQGGGEQELRLFGIEKAQGLLYALQRVLAEVSAIDAKFPQSHS